MCFVNSSELVLFWRDVVYLAVATIITSMQCQLGWALGNICARDLVQKVGRQAGRSGVYLRYYLALLVT